MIVRLATDLFKGMRQLLLPGACLVCHDVLSADRNDFCFACDELFREESLNTCPRCSSTVGPHSDLSPGCPQCRGCSFAFDRAFRMGPYEGRLRELVLQLKNTGGEDLAEAVGEAWSRQAQSRVGQLKPDVVVPVPLHWRRRWQRGFNQSEILARAWAKRLGVPCRSRWLKRVRSTPHQTHIPVGERRENVRAAFGASIVTHLRGSTVLLVDDVMTTGSTAHESARALKAAGAGSVIVAVLAHGR